MRNYSNKVNKNCNEDGLAAKPILAVLALIAIIAIYFFFSSGPNITEIGNKELKAIKSGDMQTAYDLTSTAFKKQTTPDAFTAFVGSYPILQQYTSVDFTQKQVEKTVGAIGGTIIGGDGRQMQIQIQFVKEGKSWRIQGFSIAPLGNAAPAMQADSSGATVKAILVSDVADEDGYVGKDKDTVDKLSAKIYVTAQIAAPKAGGKIEASITQLSNGQKFGPSQDDISKAGNILKAFAFTKVTNAWSAGEYEATIKLSSGDTKTLKFEIK
jgi:hypothetical protein